MEQPPTIESPVLPPAPGGADDPYKPDKRRFRVTIVGVLVAAALIVGGIVAALIAGNDEVDEGPPNGGAQASPSPEAVAPVPPATLKARAKPFVVVLTWSGPLPTDPAHRYEVQRNGNFIGYATPADRKYRDTSVLPGKRYRYEVRVETGDGVYSDPVRVRARTPIPPLVQARVDGTFDVRSRFTSKVGYGDYTAPTFGWELTPVCATGPCSVRLVDIGRDQLKLKLNRTGLMYSGGYRAQLGLNCSGTPTSSSGSITIRVTKARVVDGEWRATRVEGTMTHAEVAQLGCRASSATLSLKGKLVQ